MKKIRSLAIMAIVFTMIGVVNADIATYSGTFPATANPYTLSGIEMPMFNPSLGTLQSVSVQFNTIVSGTLSVTNDGTADTISVCPGGLAYLCWPGGGIMLTAIANSPKSYGSPFIDAQQTMDWTVEAFTGTGFGSSSDPDVLALFTGSGNLDLSVDSSVSYSWVSTYGNQLYTITPSLDTNGDWTVEYTYIPEPMTMILLGIGGLMLNRKRA